MKSIDVRSLLIGILGTALVLVMMGFSISPNYQVICKTGGYCHLLNTQSGVVKILLISYEGVLEKGFINLGAKPDF